MFSKVVVSMRVEFLFCKKKFRSSTYTAYASTHVLLKLNLGESLLYFRTVFAHFETFLSFKSTVLAIAFQFTKKIQRRSLVNLEKPRMYRIRILSVANILYTPKVHCKDTIPKQIFPGKELSGYSPNSYTHVSVCDLYIPLIGLPLLLQEIK
jgi:hypothetical protein